MTQLFVKPQAWLLASMGFAAVVVAETPAHACVHLGKDAYGSPTIVNACLDRVIASYEGSDGSWGTTGMIRPGEEERIAAKRDEYVTVKYCNYHLWTQGSCTVD